MLGVLVVNAREEKFKFVRGSGPILEYRVTDAKGKKDIIDNMHEHKVYQQILEQQHLNIIIL